MDNSWQTIYGLAYEWRGIMGGMGEKASRNALESAITQLERVARATPEEPFELREQAAVEQKGCLIQWAEGQNLILDPEKFPEQPIPGGAEHEVFVYENEFWKVTHADAFGWVPCSGDTGFPEVVPATPLDYLTRWSLVNRELGDNVKLRGVTVSNERLSVVVSQPAILGINANPDQIRNLFERGGFQKIRRFVMGAELDSSYYDPERRIGVFDASGDNVLAHLGKVTPIDVVVVEAREELHRQLIRLIG